MTSPHDGIQTGTHGHDDDHGHHDHGAAAPLPFSDGDIAGFREQDILAAKMVVLEMTGIFLLGVFLYILVALSTWPAVGS